MYEYFVAKVSADQADKMVLADISANILRMHMMVLKRIAGKV